MAMQLRYRACPHIADNPPLPQACKEVHHPCATLTMDEVSFLFTQNSKLPVKLGTMVCKGPLSVPS